MACFISYTSNSTSDCLTDCAIAHYSSCPVESCVPYQSLVSYVLVLYHTVKAIILLSVVLVMFRWYARFREPEAKQQEQENNEIISEVII